MPHSKNADSRYRILDRCFASKKRYYIKDLMEICEVSRRQIYDDIDYMKYNLDAPIVSIRDGKYKYYRYSDETFSISKRPLSEKELYQIREMLLMLSRFNDIPQFNLVETLIRDIEKDYNHKIDLDTQQQCKISIDSNQYVAGVDKIPYIYDAIISKAPLRIEYQTFHKGNRIWTIHPYFLKQYNNRWYLIGLNDDEYKNIAHIGLDRIKEIDSIHVPFIENTLIPNIEEYFEDVVGVTIPPENTIERVILRFSPHRFPYVEAKPIHGSQKIIDRETGIIRLELKLNNELESILLSFGNDVEVIEPQRLRNSIADNIKQSYEKYFRVQ